MTATQTGAPPQEALAGRRRTRRRQPFGDHVARTVADLQRQYLDGRSAATAALAHLRAAVGARPGSEYDVLHLTAVPDELLGYVHGDEPTDTEMAKHSTLTLYALHQQSVRSGMHRDGVTLGAAVRQLSERERERARSEESVLRRFTAVGTADTYDATLYHLRTMVRLLRDAEIALDYGLLADDLRRLRDDGGHDRVRALWGRDFYRAAPLRTTPDPSTSPSPD